MLCRSHDLLTALNWLLAHRAEWHLEQGRWAAAERDALEALTDENAPRFHALAIQAALKTRRGDTAAESACVELRRRAEDLGDRQNLLAAGMTRLELAWLCGDLVNRRHLAAEVYDLARQAGTARLIGEAALWLHRAGGLDQPPADAFEPFALQIAGRWREAADAWESLGRPYAVADVFADVPVPDVVLQALTVLDELGAKPRAGMARRRLAELGVKVVPRGPRPSTRSNPGSLTARQVDVLHLLAEDLTYREIADQLQLSIKTIDHHVTAIRHKLGVTTRTDAVIAGRRLGLVT